MSRVLPLLLLLACSAPPIPRVPDSRLANLVRTEILRACIDRSGAYVYGDPNDECLDPQPVVWQRWQFPLRVELLEPEGCPYRGAPVRAAIDVVNQQLGFAALQVVSFSARRSPDILVRTCAPNPPEQLLGFTAHVRLDTRMLASVIYVMDPSHPRVATLVIAHELGHALGLRHDPDERGSIMFPGATYYLGVSQFTERDRDVLRGLYAPR